MKNKLFLYSSIYLTIFIVVLTSGCGNSNRNAPKNVFLLVHGAYYGKWCWDEVKPLLEAKGQEVIVIDLPAHGVDSTNVKDVTLEMYIDKAVKRIKSINQPLILVGHSAGGMTISGVAERVPDQIKALVYVSAVIPRNGESLVSVKDPNPSGIQFFEMSEDGSVATVISELGKQVFYHDSKENEEDVEKLSPEPVAPLMTQIDLTEERFGSVPRYYIECTKDRVLSIDLQRLWQERSPCEEIFTMETGHVPFVSNPEKFIDILLNIESQIEKLITPAMR